MPIKNLILNEIVAILSGIVGCVCIFCTYVSSAEIILTYENREKDVKKKKQYNEAGKEYLADEIISVLSENDIIEIEVIVNGHIVEMGASSDCDVGSSKFFDKIYYIGGKEFINIEEFKLEFLRTLHDDKIRVVTIDGVKQK